MIRNCMFLGTHREETVSVGEFEFVVATGGAFKDDTDQFVDVMRAVLPAYEETFGGLPHATRYLVVINPGPASGGHQRPSEATRGRPGPVGGRL